MAFRKGNKTFSQGVEFRGPLALGVTQREGGARGPRRPPRNGYANSSTPDGVDACETASSSVLHTTNAGSDVSSDEIIMEHALRLVALLRDASDVIAPAGTPYEGKIVNFDNAWNFVARYHRLLSDHGHDIACPRITFHWTAEENFQSIIETNLKVPDVESGIKKKHGAAFGRGIYTCPDYKMAKEDFAYGASATFACLVLTGRQLARHHGKGHALSECHGNGFDSVVGHLPNRNCDTWVLPDSDQILPCFLVDEVAIPAAVQKLRDAIALFREPFTPSEGTCLERVAEGPPSQISYYRNVTPETNSEDHGPTRWQRRCGRGSSAAVPQSNTMEDSFDVLDHLPSKIQPLTSPLPSAEEACDHQNTVKLPYGGDIQAAMRAQDRAALQQLLAARDMAAASARSKEASETARQEVTDCSSRAASSSTGGRRWGAKSSTESFASDRKTGSRTGLVLQRGGDLLAASEDFLVHQCNCVYSGMAQGIAEAIFRAFPDADVYRERATRGRTHDVPGTVSVHGRIINLYGQLLPGKPADDAPQGGWPGVTRFVCVAEAAGDSRAARLRWFEACLSAIPRALPDNMAYKLAFPARIGCGLAGGRWEYYLLALQRFAAAHPDWTVTIYDVDQQAGPSASQYAVPTPAVSSGKTVHDYPSQAAAVSTRNGAFSSSKSFWALAVFEARRSAGWHPYDEEDQATLRGALQRSDDCDEALLDAERRAALSALADVGAFPASLGAVPGVEPAVPANTLAVRLRREHGPVEVSLAPIATHAGLGQERCAAVPDTAAVAVRLRLPPVQNGELRLPADLDTAGGEPAPRDCGRVVESAAEQAALGEANGHCGICLGDFCTKKRSNGTSAPAVQLLCSHVFHESCLERWFEERRRCPTCKKRFGHIIGTQPSVGTMSWKLESSVRLAGHPDSFTIVMQFRFPPGKDAAGQQYRARTQQAYLPHDEAGKLILELFQLAFRRRVLFDLRVSATDNKYWPAFNIHLKTAVSGGAERFGFPDDGYSQRVMEELRSNGVTVADLL